MLVTVIVLFLVKHAATDEAANGIGQFSISCTASVEALQSPGVSGSAVSFLSQSVANWSCRGLTDIVSLSGGPQAAGIWGVCIASDISSASTTATACKQRR